MLIAGAAAAAGGWIAYSNRAIDHSLPLPNAVDAPREELVTADYGKLSFYADRAGPGRPLVLIHSINAAGSAYEMRPLFHHYRGTRPVFALDLPGFGFSERSNRIYTPRLYAGAINAWLASQVRAPADVIALSLGCEFVARAALDQPALYRSLALISPSGLRPRDTGRASQRAGDQGAGESLHGLLAFPAWGRALYDLLATQASIAFFLKQSFVGPADPGLLAYDYLTSHQIGAHHAPLYFVSGCLFTPDAVGELYQPVTLPALVLYDRDAFTRFDRLPDLQARSPNWRARRIAPTLGLPHFEKLAETAQALDEFWGQA